MLHKAYKEKNVENYRPRGLLSFLGKLLERFITQKVLPYLLENELMSKFQCASYTYLGNKALNESLTI